MYLINQIFIGYWILKTGGDFYPPPFCAYNFLKITGMFWLLLSDKGIVNNEIENVSDERHTDDNYCPEYSSLLVEIYILSHIHK